MSATYSWKEIDGSLSSVDVATMVEKIIAQPNTKPWDHVDSIESDVLGTVADALQKLLENSPKMQNGFARSAAIKCLRQISKTKEVLPSTLWLQDVPKKGEHVLDYGGFAEVYNAVYKSRTVAVKVLKIKDNPEKVTRWFRHEALLWKQLRHLRILSFLGIYEDGVEMRSGNQRRFHSMYLVSPWMSNGNVNQFLQTDGPHNRLKMALEITEGIEYLHTHDPQVIHADIRGENILVKDDGTCCLVDFGISMVIETQAPTLSRSGKGGPYWMSPEVWLQNDARTPARDIYAFGCTVIEIYSGVHPFPQISEMGRLHDEVVSKKQKPPRPPQNLQGDIEELWDIVDSCLAHDATQRPTASAILESLGSQLRG